MPQKKVTKVKSTKTGKVKKDSKQEPKVDRESDMEKARTNAALWELRLKIVKQDHAELWKSHDTLARTNHQLRSQLYSAEKNLMDLTGYWIKQDEAQKEEIDMLQRSLKRQELLAREEQNKLVEDYTLQINEMKELFRKKSSDFGMIQEEMRKIKAFEKTKLLMEQELSDIRESMDAANKEYRENLNKMECKFLNEKARLESETEEMMAAVVKGAHNEAILQLDDTSRSLFRENVRLCESLKYHIKEAENLQELNNSLTEENASLALSKNTYKLTAKKYAAQLEAQNEEISQLKAKVASMENALELKACTSERELEKEKEKTQASQVELKRLQKVLFMREREFEHIKQQASVMVQQRTELGEFFSEALSQVRQEIISSRLQYKKEALQAYNRRMREATAGKVNFPPIRTFDRRPHSTNSVYSDMEAASQWPHQPGSEVEISDLTWEQKERVLELLFSKMNGKTARKVSNHAFLSASSKKKSLEGSDAAGIREEQSPATFITEAPEPVLPPNPTSLPDIHTT
ncbi:basal body-orientation factor 1-like [Xyrichtys novacula]|uniref:Basal body-orientation factor 1 n=1 Tax=Xyrichtys novacula TaxID=13765 RepID=A0AAV1GHV1_XYRNO|nr:basal body-orientation factor 1-like [Xyrichtys novacula]